MADAGDVVETAHTAFEDARDHLDADLAEAGTSDQARAVQDHHDAALAAYMGALDTAFTCAAADWEQALKDAQAAQKAVDDARKAACAFTDKLTALTALGKAVSDLITAAK